MNNNCSISSFVLSVVNFNACFVDCAFLNALLILFIWGESFVVGGFTFDVFIYCRIEDIELMHMRYALEAIVLALGAMEEAMKNETDASRRVIFYHLKDLTNHLESIKNVPRKVIYVYTLINLQEAGLLTSIM